MKKMLIAVLAVMVFVCFSSEVFAEVKGFLLQRNEIGEVNGESFYNTFNVLELNTQKVAYFFELATKPNNFRSLKPGVFYKLPFGFEAGFKYQDIAGNGFHSKYLAPNIRYKKVHDVFGIKLFIFGDIGRYFDLAGENSKWDVFAQINTTNYGLNFGAEWWGWKCDDGAYESHMRPLKIGYKFSNNVNPFVMSGFSKKANQEWYPSLYFGTSWNF